MEKSRKRPPTSSARNVVRRSTERSCRFYEGEMSNRNYRAILKNSPPLANSTVPVVPTAPAGVPAKSEKTEKKPAKKPAPKGNERKNKPKSEKKPAPKVDNDGWTTVEKKH